MRQNSRKSAVFWIPVSTITLILGLSLGCTKDKTKPNVELIQDMMEQQNVKAQEQDTFFKDGAGSRVPPENTKPIGFERYKFAKTPELVKNNKNPLEGSFTPEVLKVGATYYETNCKVCHGVKGDGIGPIKDKYPLTIPSLLSPKVRGWSDGEIYHVITMGQGTMGAYASHIPKKYRWQTVNYIRSLQKQSTVSQ